MMNRCVFGGEMTFKDRWDVGSFLLIYMSVLISHRCNNLFFIIELNHSRFDDAFNWRQTIFQHGRFVENEKPYNCIGLN